MEPHRLGGAEEKRGGRPFPRIALGVAVLGLIGPSVSWG
jgi:hypothetical protein